jgi:hypothetical protein
VIKALDNESITTDLVSGASILGDGRVVLILNMIALMERFTLGRADASGPRMSGLLSNLGHVSVHPAAQPTVTAQANLSAGGQL